jgi:hypothetical protein
MFATFRSSATVLSSPRRCFAALDLDLFSRLPSKTASLPELAAATEIAETQLATLLTVLAPIGLLAKQDYCYANAPACESYMVRGAPLYYGDSFRHQIARQIYPLLLTLDATLAGTGSAVASDQIDELNARAYAALKPGGLMLVRDFMAEDDFTGPVVAASFMLVNPTV